MAVKQTAGIMDITETPDVAVWAKGIRKKYFFPSDKVNKPSKVSSMTLYFTEKGRELLIDPANKREVERALRRSALTDESDYAQQK